MFTDTKGARFVVIGAYVADCIVNARQLPEWGHTYKARSIRTSPGGKALNLAVALARLGAEVYPVGAVGDDPLGREIIEKLTREGVDASGVQVRENTPTPVCICLVGDEDKTAFMWNIADNAAVTVETVLSARPVIQDADAVLITFEVPTQTIDEAIHLAHDCGTPIIVQPAPTLGDRSDPLSLPWQYVELVVPNEQEAFALVPGDGSCTGAELAETIARTLAVSTVVVTRGRNGCTVHRSGATKSYPAQKVSKVVDAVGGSDAFTAALALHFIADVPQDEAVSVALAAAAWAIGHEGSHESMPTIKALQSG